MGRIIAYMRRSKDDETGLSFAAQLNAITQHQGSPDAVYKDEGISGARADRPGLLAALDGLRRGDTLAVYRRDRLARDVYLSAWIDKEVQKRRARIVSATESGTNGQDPASELLRHIVSAFAAYERALVGARTRAALARRRNAGRSWVAPCRPTVTGSPTMVGCWCLYRKSRRSSSGRSAGDRAAGACGRLPSA